MLLALVVLSCCCDQVDLTINLVERKTGGLGAGTGISAAGRAAGNMPGFVGNFTYRCVKESGEGQGGLMP